MSTYPKSLTPAFQSHMTAFTHEPTQMSSTEDANQFFNMVISDLEDHAFYVEFKALGGQASKKCYHKALWVFFGYTLSPFTQGDLKREDGGVWRNSSESREAFETWLAAEEGFTQEDALLIFPSVDRVDSYT